MIFVVALKFVSVRIPGALSTTQLYTSNALPLPIDKQKLDNLCYYYGSSVDSCILHGYTMPCARMIDDTGICTLCLFRRKKKQKILSAAKEKGCELNNKYCCAKWKRKIPVPNQSQRSFSTTLSLSDHKE